MIGFSLERWVGEPVDSERAMFFERPLTGDGVSPLPDAEPNLKRSPLSSEKNSRILQDEEH